MTTIYEIVYQNLLVDNYHLQQTGNSFGIVCVWLHCSTRLALDVHATLVIPHAISTSVIAWLFHKKRFW
ncbi:MAG TPA: hypothetical protein VFW11_14905 [Cyclobacteriaceae bacterium]|nr:hypothetical protein [Cyclobacteriaceae bacterium]